VNHFMKLKVTSIICYLNYHILPTPLSSECQQVLDTSLPKNGVSGAFLRVAAIKLLMKLQQHRVDPLLVTLENDSKNFRATLFP